MKTSEPFTADKYFFFLDSVKFLGHQIQNNHIHPLKSKNDGYLKLQQTQKKKSNHVGFSILPQNISIIYKIF